MITPSPEHNDINPPFSALALAPTFIENIIGTARKLPGPAKTHPQRAFFLLFVEMTGYKLAHSESDVG